MTGSRTAAVPGIHIASCTASLAVARALGSFAVGGQLRGPLCDLVTSAPGAGPIRAEGTGQGREHPGSQGQRAARFFQPPRGLAEQFDSSVFCAPDLYPSVWIPSAARASPTGSPADRLASAA